ncbi:MAG: S8 family serine peptidase [Bdellovibrionota bacterium]
MELVRNSRFSLLILTVTGSLSLNGCLSAKRADAAASGSLPLKAVRTPLASTFSLNGAQTLEPNDPAYSGMGSISPSSASGYQFDVFAALNGPSAWYHQTDCTELRIGVVDSGVDTSHPDLVGNLDNLGTVGAPVYGRNFLNSTSNIMDDNGHGTHVVGLMAAVGNNAQGSTGVCWTAHVIVAKVTDSSGSAFLSDVVDGLEWVIDQDARVVNISMGTYVAGTSSSENQQFEDSFAGVIAKAEAKDTIIVAAAGNSGADADTNRTYPANLRSERIVAVASNAEGFGAYESLLASSNYGGHMVHLSAPGYDLLSTGRVSGASTYVFKTGTSMASPMVAGTLALMWNKVGVSNIDGGRLVNLLLDYSEPQSTGTLGQPGKYLMTGAKLDMGRALDAATNYVP